MTDRASLAADLERARTDFHQLLALVGDDDWGKPTSGTPWTNEQLLFHMVFGYMIVQRLLVLARLFGGYRRASVAALRGSSTLQHHHSTRSTTTDPA